MISVARWPWLVAACAAALAGAAGCAHAETLADAIALAYQTHPQLQSQRALQRQLDESYVQARAGFRPTISASGSANYSEPGAAVAEERGSVALTASQPLYTGGRVSAAVDAAEATVLAGRENLRAIEQSVLQTVIQAYHDVLRDQQIVAIRTQSVEVLANQRRENAARFEAGLLTRTDVARAEAQLAAARAQLTSAQAELQISRADYAAAVGQNPGELEVPPTLPGLPATVDEAFAAAQTDDPNLRRSQLAEQASRYRIAQVRAQRRPIVSLQGSIGYTGPLGDLADYSRSVSASIVASQPLFSGGIISSQIRSALEQNTSDRILIELARRNAVQAVSRAWNQMLAAQGNIASNEEGVRAATVAFEGSQEQYRVGVATTLDVLLAQEALSDAQLSLVQSRRNLHVAEASVLNAVGRLNAASLLANPSLYDPARSFNRVRRSGAVPWEIVVEGLDAVAAPSPARPSRPIPTPAATQAPVTLKPPTNTQPSAEGAPFSTTVPSTDVPTTPAPQASPLGIEAPAPAGQATPARPVRRPPQEFSFRGAVQVGAADSEARAKRALDRLLRSASIAGEPLTGKVERSQVRGRTMFRSLVVGFGNRSAARAFCRTLIWRGADCFVRADRTKLPRRRGRARLRPPAALTLTLEPQGHALGAPTTGRASGERPSLTSGSSNSGACASKCGAV